MSDDDTILNATVVYSEEKILAEFWECCVAKLGAEWQDHGLVFTTGIGTPYNISSLTNKWFKPALVKAELPTTFRLYDLRHTHATMLLANGENPKIAVERLGHSTIVLTLDTYSHVLPDMQDQAVERLEKSLFG